MVRRLRLAPVLLAGGAVVLALLTVFAIELSNTQAKSEADVKARVHERAVLAAALIDSLFQSVQQETPQLVRLYGTRTVSARTLQGAQHQNSYLVLLDSSGHVLAHSAGFTGAVADELRSSNSLTPVLGGRPYALGNLAPYGRSGVINYSVSFPTPYGTRILVTGTPRRALGSFITGELRKIPGVNGAHNYLIDGNDVVLASTNPALGVGARLNSPSQLKALAHASGDVNGHYYDQTGLANSTWRILLVAPNGPLFASVTGLHKMIPWLIFGAFALVAMLAIVLGGRALAAAGEVTAANARLARLNGELESTNTELERRAAELTRSNDELEQFASIASHDLQEPLRKIRTFTQQVTDTEAERLSDRGRDYLQRANGAAERMQKLIEDLLKFSRVATHGRAFAPVDLQLVMSEVLEDLEAAIHATGAQVLIGPLPTISGDALQMRQLMQNLLSNALKFHRPVVPPEVVVDAQVAEGSVEISFRDNGIGFDSRYRNRIFRVFERLHGRAEYPGTGIGLALCRKIAERHGGEVWAQSTLGSGSTFTVKLPLHQPEEVLVTTSGALAVEPEEAYVGA